MVERRRGLARSSFDREALLPNQPLLAQRVFRARRSVPTPLRPIRFRPAGVQALRPQRTKLRSCRPRRPRIAVIPSRAPRCFPLRESRYPLRLECAVRPCRLQENLSHRRRVVSRRAARPPQVAARPARLARRAPRWVAEHAQAGCARACLAARPQAPGTVQAELSQVRDRARVVEVPGEVPEGLRAAGRSATGVAPRAVGRSVVRGATSKSWKLRR